jgi:hypothetical protein
MSHDQVVNLQRNVNVSGAILNYTTNLDLTK